jgi:alpha-L-glutamate ligase-like protein
MILRVARQLKRLGVLGLNGRNAHYILVHNPRRLYPRVDDKLLTKELATQASIAVPRLYGVVRIEHQIGELHEFLKAYRDFVVKPARGSGGDGIVVIVGRAKGLYRRANGILMDEAELNHHVSNILSGIFSLGGHPDKALIEYCVRFDPVFEAISYQGVPDVRIIVFLGVPVMSMVRLPTRMSEGKANLHQGAIGAGIDIDTGRTLTAVWHNDIVEEHPDTGNPVSDVQIPCWERLLELAARCYELTGLGYVGVDLVLDKELGPLVLELNARPGLNIQIANRTGLLPRLKRVEAHREQLADIQERIAFAREHFAARVIVG